MTWGNQKFADDKDIQGNSTLGLSSLQQKKDKEKQRLKVKQLNLS